MNSIKINDRVIFSTPKGSVKTGTVKEINEVLHQDEYSDVYTIELENGKLHYVDFDHILQKIG